MEQAERNRLEAFRQLRKEIRGSEEYLIVGIDVAKDRHHAFFGTATGKTVLKRFVFDNTYEGFRKLLDQTEALRVRHQLSKVVYGMEPTADYHKPLGEGLIELGRNVVLVSGVTVKRNRESLDGRWDKHDGKDSANVADLVSQGKCLYYEYPSPALRGLRGLLSLKRRLKRQEHSNRVRIRNHLIAQYFPEMDRSYDRLGAEGLSIVRWCLPASEIARLDVDPFIERVTSRRISKEKRRRLGEIWEKAAESIGCHGVPGIDHEARVMVEGLNQIRATMKETERKIQDLCEQFPEYNFLLTIPGFGPDVSAKVLGAIGAPDRFDNRSQVLKLAGLDLSADRSGKDSDKAIPEISKRGKADLRYALYQAAFIASTKNQDFIRYYTSKLRGREKEKGIHGKILVKLSAKMLLTAWTLMKKKEPYDPSYLTRD
ncbi:MAG: IS110 family transposase [Deltaproteobacteria bacterium]|nr:MAG: IS110 family transposase [Deltaproteobacteria bacterium]